MAAVAALVAGGRGGMLVPGAAHVRGISTHWGRADHLCLHASSSCACVPPQQNRNMGLPLKKANLAPNFDIVWRWQLKGKQLFGTVAALLLPDETLTWSYRITLKRLKYTFVITFAPVHNAGGTPAVMWQLQLSRDSCGPWWPKLVAHAAQH